MRYIAFLAVLVAALTLAPPAAAATDWAWPVRGDVVTPYKNGDDPYASGQHRGIDIAAPVGTRVGAAAGGRVTFAGVAGGNGLTVNVRTGDGRYDVSYLHLASAAVREGDHVDRGESLGAVGTSGSRSVERPHLHLGVRDAGDRHAYRDPLEFLPPLAPPVSHAPSPEPVGAAEPVKAPPAAAPGRVTAPDATAPAAVPATGPAPVDAPAGLTTDALAPLPTGPAVTALTGNPSAGGGRAPAPASDPASATGPASAPSRASGSSTPNRSARRVAALPGSPAIRAAASGHGSPGRAVSGSDSRPPVPSHQPAGRALTRADLASPTPEQPAERAGAAEPGGPLATPDRRTAPARPDGGGVNIGRLAAVIGLVMASLCLGRPQTTRRAARSSRVAMGAVLRPLTGRG